MCKRVFFVIVFLSIVDLGISLSLLPFHTGLVILGFVLPVWVLWLGLGCQRGFGGWGCVAGVGLVVDLCCWRGCG